MIDCRSVVGKPFKIHGRDLNGFDCLGLCLYMSRQEGKELPDVPYKDINVNKDECFLDIARLNFGKEKLERPEESCWIEFSGLGRYHVGFYIGRGLFVHASFEKKKVVIESLAKWKNRIKGFYRV